MLLAAASCAAAGTVPRIVSCAPAATETIFDLGGQGCLVGRSSACLYPAAATNLPSVGAYSAPSIERIVSLAPTHVVMTYLSDPSMSNRLERLGIRVLQFPCERLADYAPMRARLAALCGLAPRRMLAVVQREPMIVAGKETLPDDVLAEVGCVNAVTNRKGYFVLSPEARVKLAPDGEVDFSMNYDLTRLGPKLPAAIAELRRKLAISGASLLDSWWALLSHLPGRCSRPCCATRSRILSCWGFPAARRSRRRRFSPRGSRRRARSCCRRRRSSARWSRSSWSRPSPARRAEVPSR